MAHLLKISIFLFVFMGGLNAQTPMNMTSGDINSLMLKDAGEGGSKSLEPVEGSIYLFDNYEKGIVQMESNDYSDVSMNYNILSDVFHFKMGGHTLVLDPRKDLELVKVKDMTFAVKTYEYKAKSITGFLVVLVDGKYSLLAKKNITLRPAKPPKALESEPTPARYIRPSDTYFLAMPDGSLRNIQNGKDIVALFDTTTLQAEAKKKKISLKKEKQLPALVDLLNELKL